MAATSPIKHNPLLGDLDEFIQNNKRLVYENVKRCLKKTSLKVDPEDLEQEGMIGLMKAYEKFDGRGAFSTYAFHHIRNEIMKFIRDKVQTIHIPAHLYELTGKVLRQKWMDKSPEFISQNLGCTLEMANYALQHLNFKTIASLNKIISQQGMSEVEMVETFGTSDDLSIVAVTDFINSLSGIHRQIAILAFEGKMQSEIAPIIGTSSANVWLYMERIRESARRYFEKPKKIS